MVIALPLPTLQTRVMDPLSLIHHGITPMGTTRGYERSIKTLLSLLSELFLTFCFSVLLKDGYQQNYKRGAGQGPRGVSRGSTQAIRS